jgi:hypothetical protein
VNGDDFHPGAYDETAFPMIRCFNHWKEATFTVVEDGHEKEDYMTINVTYAGNVERLPLYWELPIKKK